MMDDRGFLWGTGCAVAFGLFIAMLVPPNDGMLKYRALKGGRVECYKQSDTEDKFRECMAVWQEGYEREKYDFDRRKSIEDNK